MCFLTAEISFPLGDGGNSSFSDFYVRLLLWPSQATHPKASRRQRTASPAAFGLQRGSPRVSRARLPAAGHGCPSSHGGMKPSWEQPPLPQSWLDPDVPFLLSRSKGERSIVSQFVKPKSFNSTLSLKDATFYMKIRASKKKQKFASNVYKLCPCWQ